MREQVEATNFLAKGADKTTLRQPLRASCGESLRCGDRNSCVSQ
jgi:hypothetical protein